MLSYFLPLTNSATIFRFPFTKIRFRPENELRLHDLEGKKKKHLSSPNVKYNLAILLKLKSDEVKNVEVCTSDGLTVCTWLSVVFKERKRERERERKREREEREREREREREKEYRRVLY